MLLFIIYSVSVRVPIPNSHPPDLQHEVWPPAPLPRVLSHRGRLLPQVWSDTAYSWEGSSVSSVMSSVIGEVKKKR